MRGWILFALLCVVCMGYATPSSDEQESSDSVELTEELSDLVGKLLTLERKTLSEEQLDCLFKLGSKKGRFDLMDAVMEERVERREGSSLVEGSLETDDTMSYYGPIDEGSPPTSCCLASCLGRSVHSSQGAH